MTLAPKSEKTSKKRWKDFSNQKTRESAMRQCVLSYDWEAIFPLLEQYSCQNKDSIKTLIDM